MSMSLEFVKTATPAVLDAWSRSLTESERKGVLAAISAEESFRSFVANRCDVRDGAVCSGTDAYAAYRATGGTWPRARFDTRMRRDFATLVEDGPVRVWGGFSLRPVN